MQEQNYLGGISYEDVCAIRKQMLDLTKEELAELIPLFDQAGEDGSVCVIGNKDAINPDDSWSVYNI